MARGEKMKGKLVERNHDDGCDGTADGKGCSCHGALLDEVKRLRAKVPNPRKQLYLNREAELGRFRDESREIEHSRAEVKKWKDAFEDAFKVVFKDAFEDAFEVVFEVAFEVANEKYDHLAARFNRLHDVGALDSDQAYPALATKEINRLNNRLKPLTESRLFWRDQARELKGDIEGLYDVITDRDAEIEELKDDVALLLAGVPLTRWSDALTNALVIVDESGDDGGGGRKLWSREWDDLRGLISGLLVEIGRVVQEQVSVTPCVKHHL